MLIFKETDSKTQAWPSNNKCRWHASFHIPGAVRDLADENFPEIQPQRGEWGSERKAREK